LICAEEIERYHLQLQKSLDDLTTIINELNDTTGENRREVAHRFQIIDDRITTIAKDQNNTTHTRVTESPGQFGSKDARGDAFNGENEVTVDRRKDDARDQNEDNHVNDRQQISQNRKDDRSTTKNRKYKNSRLSTQFSRMKSGKNDRRNYDDYSDPSDSSSSEEERWT
jgi:hypothetical protein